MSLMTFGRRLAAVSVAALALVACDDDDPDIVKPVTTRAGGSLFDSYVAIGNSITAGYQSGGINDSTQRESYAFYLAQQAGTRYSYASLKMPGCPPPIDNFQTQTRVAYLEAGKPATTSTTCELRNVARSGAAPLNNVAVPGALVIDPTSATTSSSNTLTSIILGGRTQTQLAVDADPTFATVWIGNNDVLQNAAAGLLRTVTGVTTRDTTSRANFQTRYTTLLNELKVAPRLKGAALIGVVNVTNAPVLFPVAALFNPQFRAGFEQFTGGTLTIHPSCTATTTALLSFAIVPQIRLYRQNPAAAGAHPPVIACTPGAVPGTLVGDVFVLDPTETAAVTGLVAAYNTFIEQQATANGWIYIDPNPLLVNMRNGTNGQTDCINEIPNLASATLPYGTCISLDGVHPAKRAHQIFANTLIDAINAKYGSQGVNIPKLTISASEVLQ